MANDIDWIAVDRSEASLRAWGMNGTNAVCQHSCPTQAELAAALSEWTIGQPAIAIVAGDRSATLQTVPVKPANLPLQRGADVAPGIETYIVPGLSQADPDDQAHGIETRIAGFLSLNPRWDGVICLPGPRTRWVLVSADEIVSMQPFATLLIRDALAPVLDISPRARDWDQAAFVSAVSDAMSRPEALAARLASVNGADAPEQLSGLLIGVELAAARPWWLGQQLAVIGPTAEARLYSTALGQQGTPVVETDEAKMTLAGLKVFRKKLAETN